MSDFDDNLGGDLVDGTGSRRDNLAYIGRHPALTAEPGAEETDEEFCRRREQEELVLAMSAPNQIVRDAHYALADEYRIQIVELTSRRPG